MTSSTNSWQTMSGLTLIDPSPLPAQLSPSSAHGEEELADWSPRCRARYAPPRPNSPGRRSARSRRAGAAAAPRSPRAARCGPRPSPASARAPAIRPAGLPTHPAARPRRRGIDRDRRPAVAPLLGALLRRDEKGSVRFSRLPRVRAMFRRIPKIQVRRAERPSKRSMPLRTPTQVSWTTSSATAREGTCAIARRSNAGDSSSTSDAYASRSPRRSASTNSASAVWVIAATPLRRRKRCGPCGRA